MQTNDIHDLIDQAAIVVGNFGQARLNRGVHCWSVPARSPEGFRTSFAIDDQQCTLYFDECAVDVASVAQALDLLRAALSGEIRLRIDTVSGRAYRWSVERQNVDGNWRAEHVIAVFNFKFWGRVASVYRQNDFCGRRFTPAIEVPAQLTEIAA